MSDLITFLTALKTAGNQYLAAPRTRVKSILKWSSNESQALALTLSQLNPSSETDFLEAVKALVTFIKAKNSYEQSRRLWSDYIFRLIKDLANDPFKTDLSEKCIAELKRIEFVYLEAPGAKYPLPERRSKFVRDSICLLFNGFGYGTTPVERHPTLIEKLKTPEGCDEIECEIDDPNSTLHPYGHYVLGYFLRQDDRPNLKNAQAFYNNCLTHVTPRSLYRTLCIISTGKKIKATDSDKYQLPLFLEVLAKTNVSGFDGTIIYYSSAEIDHFDEHKVRCLEKLTSMGLGKISLNELAALVTSDPDYLKPDKEVTSTFVAEKIHENKPWLRALFLTHDCKINLYKILDENQAELIGLDLKEKLSRPTNRM